jgi:hypothetical protein
MTAPEPTNPFGTGPFQALLHAVRLRSGAEDAIGRRAVLALIVAWVPLAILAQLQGLAIGTGRASFLQDFAAYARFLVAIPLLVAAEAPARRWLTRVLLHFPEARLIPPAREAEFTALLGSTRHLLGSRLALLAIVVLAYTATLTSTAAWVSYGAANWIAVDGDHGRAISYAGWWRLLVSQPLFLSLLLTWLWRLFLWLRCLRAVARMDLRIVASHPDKAGGLGFVGQSLRAFPLFAVAFGSAIAGTLANMLTYDNRSAAALAPFVVATIVVILLLCAGPLLVFMRPLRQAQDDAELTYGALATSLGLRFEERWLDKAPDVGPDALAVPDFSATTDLYSVAGQVVEMRFIPLEIKDFVPLLIGTVLPFLPILLQQVSFTELVEVVRHVLM